ncbi:MAG: DUF4295 domain-containing protein [Flavobacteriales bacterium]|jgi:hypothetical protein|tara:strand:+ start:754 stop:912 length:159 start_codon:yes stop_codon:yes gene_type:complete
MAKKTVASLQKGGGKQHTRVIKMIKNADTGAYGFRSAIVLNVEVKEWFAANS